MEKDFEDYIHNARNEFVDAVNTYVRNKHFRVKCEDILLAFDQLKWKLRESQKPETSDEALPIADVGERYLAIGTLASGKSFRYIDEAVDMRAFANYINEIYPDFEVDAIIAV